MALDRTWYNSLVDDDGTNTVGSVWNKASVDALMDAVDAALPFWQAWTPLWYNNNAVAGTVGAQYCRYAFSGQLLFVNLNVSTLNFSGSAFTQAWFQMPPGTSVRTPIVENFPLAAYMGGAGFELALGTGRADDPSWGAVSKAVGTFPGSTNISIVGQGFYLL